MLNSHFARPFCENMSTVVRKRNRFVGIRLNIRGSGRDTS